MAPFDLDDFGDGQPWFERGLLDDGTVASAGRLTERDNFGLVGKGDGRAVASEVVEQHGRGFGRGDVGDTLCIVVHAASWFWWGAGRTEDYVEFPRRGPKV